MASNLLVVLANDGRMPAYRGTPEVFEILRQGPIGQYILGGSGTRLGFLGDWIALPGPIGVLFPEGYSPGDLIVVLGLVTTKTARCETIDELVGRIREAAKVVPLDRLALSPQCGFATSVIGNALSIDDQRAKLRTIADAAAVVWP